MAIKVLIVDDMKNFLDLETSFLKRTDCTVLKAVNGLDALRIAKAERPDIVFLDLEMPVMNGIECCRFIKSDISLKDIPVVIVTASSKKDECFKAGCDSYVNKPVGEDRFLEEIKKFVPIKERNDPRIRVNLSANVDFKGSKSAATVLDISKSGILIETKEPFAVGTTIIIDFLLPGIKSRVRAKTMVVREVKERSSEHGRYGLAFLKLDDKYQSLLGSFIDASTK